MYRHIYIYLYIHISIYIYIYITNEIILERYQELNQKF